MPSDKFKGCFIDESDLYTYTIEYDGELLANAHTLTSKNRSDIERNSMKKAWSKGEVEIDIDTHALKTYTIKNALTSWELPRKLDADSISVLSETYRDVLYNAIQDHENKVAGIVEDTEKN